MSQRQALMCKFIIYKVSKLPWNKYIQEVRHYGIIQRAYCSTSRYLSQYKRTCIIINTLAMICNEIIIYVEDAHKDFRFVRMIHLKAKVH